MRNTEAKNDDLGDFLEGQATGVGFNASSALGASLSRGWNASGGWSVGDGFVAQVLLATGVLWLWAWGFAHTALGISPTSEQHLWVAGAALVFASLCLGNRLGTAFLLGFLFGAPSVLALLLGAAYLSVEAPSFLPFADRLLERHKDALLLAAVILPPVAGVLAAISKIARRIVVSLFLLVLAAYGVAFFAGVL